MADKKTIPSWLWIIIVCGIIFLLGGWFPFVFAITYIVTMFDIFAEHAPLVLKCSVAICFFVPFLLRMLLPEQAKNMLYFLIPVAFMTAQAYSFELDMAAVQDAVLINHIFQPLFCNILPVVAGILLGGFVKNIIEKLK